MMDGEIDDVKVLKTALSPGELDDATLELIAKDELPIEQTLPANFDIQLDAPLPFIVGLSAKKRHGKDSVAMMLNLELTDIDDDVPQVMIISFANPLKSLARHVFAWNGKKDSFGRWLLQHLGTEKAHAEKGADYWIQQLRAYISKVLDSRSYPPKLIVITDVRFPQEVDFVQNWRGGGEVWRIIRMGRASNVDAKGEYADGSHDDLNKHASETALDGFKDWDVVIKSESGLNYLHEKVMEQVTRLQKEGRIH